MRTIVILLPIFGVLFSGCGTTDATKEQVSAPPMKTAQTRERKSPDEARETYVGGQIFKIDRTRPLPNAFGGADIFGRKVYAGFSELRYHGLTEDGKIILRITEVGTHSTETTMSRSNIRYFNGHVDQQGNFSGTVTQPPKGSTELLPPDTTEFAIDANKESELTIVGMKVRFLEFTSHSLKYTLEKEQK